MQDEQYQALCNSLKNSDQKFREINKNIILELIRGLITPKPKDPAVRLEETKIDLAYTVTYFIASSIWPETTAKQRERYKEWKDKPAKMRAEAMEEADRILESITHRDRITFYEDVTKKGLGVASDDWMYKITERAKVSRVKYRVRKST